MILCATYAFATPTGWVANMQLRQPSYASQTDWRTK